MRKPKIVQIAVARDERGEGDEANYLYGLADDGSVWMAEPNIYKHGEWLKVVATPSTETTEHE